jgi:hypothetical protein
MKVSLVNVVMLGSGIVLLYSGIKGYDPRDVIRYGLGGKKPKKLGSAKTEQPKVNPNDHPGDMPWTYPNPNNGPIV